jgi:hypothetical protein
MEISLLENGLLFGEVKQKNKTKGEIISVKFLTGSNN